MGLGLEMINSRLIAPEIVFAVGTIKRGDQVCSFIFIKILLFSKASSEAYATMKMNQKCAIRNRAVLAQSMGGPGSVDPWALAQNATLSTIKFSKIYLGCDGADF